MCIEFRRAIRERMEKRTKEGKPFTGWDVWNDLRDRFPEENSASCSRSVRWHFNSKSGAFPENWKANTVSLFAKGLSSEVLLYYCDTPEGKDLADEWVNGKKAPPVQIKEKSLLEKFIDRILNPFR